MVTTVFQSIRARRWPKGASLPMASFHMLAEPPNLFGTYQIAFSGQGTGRTGDDDVFIVSYEVVRPPEPRLVALPTGTVWLYNFAPNETVQLLRYDVSDRGWVEWEYGGGITETYTLVAEQIVTIDDDGTKTLFGFSGALDGPYGPTSGLFALGETSGEVGTGFPYHTEETVLLNR